ncbi:MAG: PAS domain-containing protein [Cyclobacteriaceae bacterium]|nr:PAS domain-containing protein [Cyclobacteriaceae bacterium]
MYKDISSLNILIIEDNLMDVELIQIHLKNIAIPYITKVVSQKKDIVEALDSYNPNMILSDYQLSEFTGINVMEWTKGKSLNIPFIIVTGVLNDEKAVDCMKQGAWDYVLKDRIHRLPLAIEGAVEKYRILLEEEQIDIEHELILDSQNLAKIGTWKWDVINDVVIWSDKLYDIFEVTKDKPSLSLDDFIQKMYPDNDVEKVKKNIYKILNIKKPFNFREKIITPNRNIKYINTYGNVKLDRNNKVKILYGTSMDITELVSKEIKIKSSEEKLERSYSELKKAYDEINTLNKEYKLQNENLNKAQEIGNIGHWELNIVSGKLIWSRQIYKIFKLSPDEFEPTYDNFLNVIHPDDRDMVNNAYTTSLETKKPYKIEHRLKFSDGTIGYVSEKCETTYNKNGDPILSVGTVLDVTAQKKHEVKNNIINSISSKLNSNININDFCRHIYIELQTVKPFSNFYVSKYDDVKNTNTIFFHQTGNNKKNDITQERIAGNGLSEYIIKTKKGLFLNKDEFIPFYKEHKLTLYGEKINSWIGVPLMSEHRVVGVLAAQSFNNDNAYDEYDLEILSFIGTQVGSFIERQSSLQEIKQFEKYFSVAMDMLCIAGTDTFFKKINPKFSEVLGYKEKELLSKSFVEFIHPEDKEATLLEVKKLSKGVNTINFVNRYSCKNGKYKWLLWSAAFDEKTDQIYAAARDISKQKTQEQELIEQNINIYNQNKEYLALNEEYKSQNEKLSENEEILINRNKKLLKHKEVILKLSTLKETSYVKTIEKILKTASKTLNVKRVSYWVYKDFMNTIKCEILYNANNNSFEEGLTLKKKDYPNYFKALLTDKAIVAHDAHTNKFTKEFSENYLTPLGITSMLDVFIQKQGKNVGVICFEHIGEKRKWELDEEQFATSIATIISLATETAERKEAEIKVIEGDKKLQSLFDHANVGIAFVTLNKKILKVNNAFCEMLGYSEKELLSMVPADFTHPDDIQTTINLNEQVIKGEIQNYTTIKRYITKSGRTIWVELSSTFVRDANNKILYGFGIIKNITQELELKKEKLLRDARLEIMFNEAPLGLAINDSQNGILYEVNDYFADILKISKEEVKNLDWKSITHPDDITQDLKLMKQLHSGKISKYTIDKRFILKGNKLAYTTITVKSLGKDTNGRPIHLTMIEDITNRREAEQTIQEQNENLAKQNKEYLSLNEEFIAQNAVLVKNQEVLIKRNKKLLDHKKILLELSTLKKDNLKSALRIITKTASMTLEVERVRFWRFQNSFTELKCEILYVQNENSYEKGVVLKKVDYPVFIKTILDNRSIVAHDAQSNKYTNEFTKDYFKPLKIKSVINILVQIHGKNIGVLCFEHVGEKREWEIEDEQFAFFIANIISLSIESSERRETQLLLEKERKYILRAQFDGEEREKNRISAELHDGLGQILTAAKFSLAALGNKNELNDNVKKKINDIKNIINEANIETGRISKHLLPRVLEDYGLIVAVEKILAEIQDTMDINTLFTVNPNVKISEKKYRIIYRIIQESINNAIKHSNATYLEVIFDVIDDYYTITVSDNGKGFKTDFKKTGLGLENLKQRALSIDADLEIISKVGKGTTVILKMTT